jgi:hypothetical protein
VTIRNSTFSRHSGAGIYNNGQFNGHATLKIGDTILSGSGLVSANLRNDQGAITSYGYNLSSDDAGGYLANTGDQVNVNPLLGPLRDNGGPTFTHALLPGSPAIDKGNRNLFGGGYNWDQRGIPRPLDDPHLANATGGDGSDIGAFETPFPLGVTKLQVKVNFNPAKRETDTCKLTGALDLGAGFNPSNKVVTVDIGGAQQSFKLNAKGRGSNYKSTCKLSFVKKSQLWKLTVSMKNGSWATPWAEYGMENVTTPKEGATVSLPVTVTVEDTPFGVEKSLLYKATAEKSGTAKCAAPTAPP